MKYVNLYSFQLPTLSNKIWLWYWLIYFGVKEEYPVSPSVSRVSCGPSQKTSFIDVVYHLSHLTTPASSPWWPASGVHACLRKVCHNLHVILILVISDWEFIIQKSNHSFCLFVQQIDTVLQEVETHTSTRNYIERGFQKRRPGLPSK